MALLPDADDWVIHVRSWTNLAKELTPLEDYLEVRQTPEGILITGRERRALGGILITPSVEGLETDADDTRHIYCIMRNGPAVTGFIPYPE